MPVRLLCQSGKFDRGVLVAGKAREAADIGPDYPGVATSLVDRAPLSRATRRGREAEAREQRATRIHGIYR